MAKSDTEPALDAPPPANQDEQPAAPAEEPAPPPAASSASTSSSRLSAPASIRDCPIPTGAVLFGELTSAFVDGSRLLRFLGDRRHTGAVVDAGRNQVQVALLYEGAVIGLVGVGDGGTRRIERLNLAGPGGQEEHDLSVLTYRPEVTLALGQLVNLPERFERMHGSFVDLPALLAYLKREKANGAVRVTTGEDAGVVLVRNGEVLGAYTRQRPELEDADVVYPLAKAVDAEIDVHTGSLTIPPASVAAGSVV